MNRETETPQEISSERKSPEEVDQYLSLLRSSLTSQQDSINDKNSSESISRQEFLEVIAQASSIQQFEQDRLQGSRLDSILSPFIRQGDEERLPESALYEAAKTLMIDAKYIEKARSQTISPERMLESLEAVNGELAENLVIKIYESQLFEKMKSTYPLMKFKQGRYTGHFWISTDEIETEEIKEPKRFMHKERTWVRTNDVSKGIVSFNYDKMIIGLDSPLFLEACAETLKLLNKTFKMDFKIECNYNPAIPYRIEGAKEK